MAISTLELLGEETKFLEIKYKNFQTGEEMTTFSRVIPERMDKFQPGRLFRYFDTQRGFSLLRSFDSEEDFQKFNQ